MQGKDETISTPKPTAPELSYTQSSSRMFTVESSLPVATALPYQEGCDFALPVIVAVKKSHEVIIDTANQMDKQTLKVIAMGDAEQKQRYVNLIGRLNCTDSYINTIGIDYSLKQTQFARYQVWNVASQERYRSIAKAYFRNSHIHLLFGQTSIQTTMEYFPADLVSSYDFFAVRYNNENKFEHIARIEDVRSEHLETHYISKNQVSGFLDEITFNLLQPILKATIVENNEETLVDRIRSSFGI